MYMSEISKSKVSGLKAQKMIILLTLKHVSAISEHPVLTSGLLKSYFSKKFVWYFGPPPLPMQKIGSNWFLNRFL